jgi:hypothetical protein
MPAETSIPCSKEARDLVKDYCQEQGLIYDEALKDAFSERAEARG